MREKIISNTLFIVAALALISAIVCFAMAGANADYHGSTVRSYGFGADFYTEVQNAAATAANNIRLTNQYLGELMTISGLGMVLVSVLCFGLGKAYCSPKITWEEAKNINHPYHEKNVKKTLEKEEAEEKMKRENEKE